MIIKRKGKRTNLLIQPEELGLATNQRDTLQEVWDRGERDDTDKAFDAFVAEPLLDVKQCLGGSYHR